MARLFMEKPWIKTGWIEPPQIVALPVGLNMRGRSEERGPTRAIKPLRRPELRVELRLDFKKIPKG